MVVPNGQITLRPVTERIDDLMAQLTLDEKATLTAGIDMWHAQGVERLGIRGLKVSDGPNGARGSFWVGTTSACLPCGTALGATWNPDLVRRVGVLAGEETITKGADVLLAPTINLHRSPLAGRNFECPSEDPFLTSRYAVAYITGVQSTGVATAVKHFVANDSEFERHTISSDVDERTLRELYLPMFEAAIGEARSMSIMAAYNKLNDVYCSEQPFLMGLLDDWGFDGFVISDWWSVKSTIGTGISGCDLEMPGPQVYLGTKLSDAIRAGELPEAALDAKVRRLLGVMERLGVLDEPTYRPDTSRDRPEDRVLLREAAAEAVVLLTNDGVLPLRSDVRRVAVIGPNADVAVAQGGGSASVNPHHVDTVLDGLRARYPEVEFVLEPGCDGYRNAPPIDPRWLTPTDRSTARNGLTLDYFAGRTLQGEPTATMTAESCRFTWLGDPWTDVIGGDFSARLSGTLTAPVSGTYTFTLIVGGQARLWIDGELVLDLWEGWTPGTAFFGLGSEEIRAEVTLVGGAPVDIVAEMACMENLPACALLLGAIAPMGDDSIERAVAAAAGAEVAIVVVGLNQDWETEGEDRASMDLPGAQPALIRAVAATGTPTVVLVSAGSPVTMDWADEVNAVAQLWYLGQETGGAVADIVSGDRNPSAKLPTTFPVRYEDHPAIDNYPGADGHVVYGEGLFVGYRGYESRGVVPRFPFGHGLSYTSFELGTPQLADSGTGLTVGVPVTNIGSVAGAEVVQLYVAEVTPVVARPLKELKGFAKVMLEAGETAIVSMELDDRSFAHWDLDSGRWVVTPGDYRLLIGTSSADISQSITITRH